jgi:hypothetical protein
VFPATFGLVVVFRIEIHGAENLQNTKLLAPFHILGKRCGHGFSLVLCRPSCRASSINRSSKTRLVARCICSHNILCKQDEPHAVGDTSFAAFATREAKKRDE